MISRQDAKFVIREIRNLKYYRHRVKEYDDKIYLIDLDIYNVTAPHSPVISDEPKTTAHKSHEARWAELHDKKDKVKAERFPWAMRLQKAEDYYNQLLQTRDREFVMDFFKGMTMEALQEKYHYSNAYDRILRITKNKIEHL